MELDEFKMIWKAYDQKLDATQQLGQKLLQLTLQNRSQSTIDKMLRELRPVLAILSGVVVFFSAVIAGNAFDYTRPIHYVPACLYMIVAIVGLYMSIQHRNNLRNKQLLTHDLYQTLTDIITLRLRHTRLMKWVWMSIMLAGSMVMLPTIARKLPEGWLNTLFLLLIPVGITTLSIGLASMAGMFKDLYVDELREQMNELETLR
ncbi:hypothetical protein GCM10028806_03020 [Spirosoma terrae]|uniref:Uncharacterized protein n=1 Tax=Spirosoma terrae TaxID=1968276 RepID=A0A6L9LCG1_9BACT|nr:hypothetical protein [Spirosoma terrae]NDU98140.1 hypothetical protein [Spirosoma terrae]